MVKLTTARIMLTINNYSKTSYIKNSIEYSIIIDLEVIFFTLSI